MAGRWRIRHKLMLGLGLIVGVLALLLAGTLKGMLSYRATTSSMDSKLNELQEAVKLRVAITYLTPTDSRVSTREDLGPKLRDARDALAAYEDRLRETLQRRRDSDKGFIEGQLVEALKERFATLEEAIDKADQPRAGFLPGQPTRRPDDDIVKAVNELSDASMQLQEAICHDLYARIIAAKSDYRSTLWLVLSTSIVGVVLMVGLLRFYYAWVYYPIRDLEQGVGRVAQGHFENRIEVHSGDEIEDLAEAFNDMTGRLHDMYANLTQQVNERSRQLVRSERLAGVGFLAAGVAHEINNPLASIAFCAEALESRLASAVRRPASASKATAGGQPATDEETVAKYLKMIQDEAFRCKKITERLLEFSRPGERHREPADLVEIVQSVLDMLQHHQSCKGKQLVLKPLGQVVAQVNEQEIKSVVLNLVVNALDSMEDGGTLTIRVRQRGGMAEMEFTDTGCGMKPEVLENIFEPFFTRSRTGKGTGLGLTISHRIINQHGGEIEASSPGPGQGSTFMVRLPLRPVEAVVDETPVRTAA